MQNEQSAPAQGMPQQTPPGPAPAQSNGLAIAGLVVAIVGLLMCWVTFLGLIVSVGGLVLSIMGMKKASSVGGAGKGAAVGGLVVAIFGVIFGGAFTACQVACAAASHRYGAELEQIGKDFGQEMESLEKAMREAQQQAADQSD